MGLIEDAVSGNVRALARLATHIENDDPLSHEAIDQIYPLTGNARTIGITGPPGVGKSSFANQFVRALRSADQTCAVIAVDPSSTLSGGAMLGDRIRMLEHHSDPGVFVRSTASRGRTGGLAPSTAGLIHLFDAAGFDFVIVETVGVGQEDVDIVGYVESVVLVQAPGFGDTIQTLKAGVLEVADIFVVNKADLPGAQVTVKALRGLLSLAIGQYDRLPPVIAVSATERTGIEDVVRAVDDHRKWLRSTGVILRRRDKLAVNEITGQMRRLVDDRIERLVGQDSAQVVIEQVVSRRLSPRRAAEKLIAGSLPQA